MKNLRFTGSLVRTFAFLSFSFSFISPAEAQQWPEAGREAKPYTRWWWHGSAVDSAGIDYCMTQYAKAGIGGVEITPIYGVVDNEANEIEYLSPRWMRMLSWVCLLYTSPRPRDS